ncbi:hypothetical protein MTYM_01646 [Methylococcales bacterium]|nr:hypothetical protein MTYM_01646 [Methylococcales bacterium]
MSSEMMKWLHVPLLDPFKDEMNKLFHSFNK